MLRIINVNRSELEDRFEARFYYNKHLLENSFKKLGFVTIEQISKLKSGTTPKHSDEKQNETDVYFVKSADVKRFEINLETVSFISEGTHKRRKGSKIISKDVLLTNTGKYMGFCSLVSEDIKEANINQNIIRIRINEGETKINSYLLTAFLNSKFGQIEIESMLTSTGQKYLNMTKFYNFKIPLIPKEVVKEISEQIKKTYELKDKSIKLIEEAKSLLYKSLGIDFNKIPKENFFSVNLSDLKQEDLWIPKYKYPIYVNTLNKIKSKFKTIKLGVLTKPISGDEVGSENYIGLLDAKKDSVPFIRTTDLVNYEADFFSDFLIPKEIAETLKQNLQKRDILFTKDGKIGMMAVVGEDNNFVISSGITRIRLNEEAKKLKFTPEYLFIILSMKEIGLYQALRRTVYASTLPHLREERLEETEIPLIDEKFISEITKLVEDSIRVKDERRKIIMNIRNEIDKFLIE